MNEKGMKGFFSDFTKKMAEGKKTNTTFKTRDHITDEMVELVTGGDGGDYNDGNEIEFPEIFDE